MLAERILAIFASALVCNLHCTVQSFLFFTQIDIKSQAIAKAWVPIISECLSSCAAGCIFQHESYSNLRMPFLPVYQVYKAVLDGSKEVSVKFMDMGHASEFEISQFACEMMLLRANKHKNVTRFYGGWLDKVSAPLQPLKLSCLL